MQEEKPGIIQRVGKALYNPDYKNFTLEDPNQKINGFTIAEIFGATKSSAGANVTVDNAQTLSAVWACVRAYAAPFSYFPIVLYNHKEGTRERVYKDPILSAINMPLPYMTRNVMMERAMMHVILWGNAYIEPLMERGVVSGFYIHHPSTVAVKVSGEEKDTVVVYDVKKKDGTARTLPARKMIHVAGLGDGLIGKSVIACAAEDIGLEIAVREYGANFFEKGGKPQGLLSFKQFLKADQKTQVEDAHAKARRNGGDLILGAEAHYQPFSVPPEDAQFLGTRYFSVTTIARWFGVPPWKIGALQEGATFSNIEEQGIGFLKDSLAPIVEKFESEFNNKLFGVDSDKRFEFDMEAYLRADSKATAELNRTNVQNGLKTMNEIRSKNGDNPIEGGDRLVIGANMIPVDLLESFYTQNKATQGQNENTNEQ